MRSRTGDQDPSVTETKSISPFIAALLLETCRYERYTYWNEEEASLVGSWSDQETFEEHLTQYAGFLEARGFPLIAARTRDLSRSRSKSNGLRSVFGARIMDPIARLFTFSDLHRFNLHNNFRLGGENQD